MELAKRIALPPGLTLDRYRKFHELFECICSTTAWNVFKVNLPAVHFTSMYLEEFVPGFCCASAYYGISVPPSFSLTVDHRRFIFLEFVKCLHQYVEFHTCELTCGNVAE